MTPISQPVAATLFLTLSLLLQKTESHPNGAPPRLCSSMKPEHAEEPMLTSQLPFTISLNKVFIRGTGRISIKVTSKDPKKFKLAGILFVVKRPNSRGMANAFGSFDPRSSRDDLKTIDCFGREGSRSGITHSHPRPKTALSFDWIAPNETSAEYELHATLVRDYNSYWADYVHPERIIVSVNATHSKGRRRGTEVSHYVLFMIGISLLLF